MYSGSAQGVVECVINVCYYNYYYFFLGELPAKVHVPTNPGLKSEFPSPRMTAILMNSA